MKKFTLLFLIMLLGITGVDAKSRITTLWEGTSSADAEIHLEKSKFTNAESSDVLRITFSFTTAGSMHLCWKTGEGGDWSAKAFNGIGEWPYFSDTSVSSAEFSINATDLATLQSYGMYIYGFASSTITKIELIHTCQPTSESENLLTGDWVVAVDGWEKRNFAAQTTAKIGDVIQIEITVASGWKYTEVQVKDSEGSDLENTSKYVGNFAEETRETFEFEINNINDLEKIQSTGFRINASNHATIRSIKLLSYADSYDAVSIKVGSEGVATYSNGGKNVQISACDALKAYYASAVAKGTVTLTELTGCIPASTGVMIYGAEGTYTVPVGDEGWPSITTNYLKATGDYSKEVTASTDGTYHYIFAKDNSDGGKIAFFKLTLDYTLAAHRAYLETEVTPGARLVLKFEDDPTAIGEVKSAAQPVKADNVYYNLNGQRVEKPTKGIYILNGKKVLF